MSVKFTINIPVSDQESRNKTSGFYNFDKISCVVCTFPLFCTFAICNTSLSFFLLYFTRLKMFCFALPLFWEPTRTRPAEKYTGCVKIRPQQYKTFYLPKVYTIIQCHTIKYLRIRNTTRYYYRSNSSASAKVII